MSNITSISKRVLEEEVRKRREKLVLLEKFIQPYVMALDIIREVYISFEYKEKELLPLFNKVQIMLSGVFSQQELCELKSIKLKAWVEQQIALLIQEISGFNKDLGVY